jgi:tetratricopeptide (TPR) repeat protein
MSRRLWLAVLVLTAATAAAEDASVPAALAAGDQAVSQFDLAKAVAAYQEAVALDPKSYDANWKLARMYSDKATLSTGNAGEQKKLCVEAERFAREAVRLNPDGFKGHVYLAIAVGKLALYEGGKRKVELSREVKAEAEKAIALNPKEDIAYHVLGIWNREMAELNWVLRKFAELFYGKFPPASLEQATTHLRKATELAPNVVAHHVELGITLADASQWSDADKELEHALSLPKAWVTDDHYKALAKQTLERVTPHLK